jgi:membrane protein implicated in regulation of membrane protease activity
MAEMLDGILGDHPELVGLGLAILAFLAGISWLGNQRAILLPLLIVGMIVAAFLTLAVLRRWRRTREGDQHRQND